MALIFDIKRFAVHDGPGIRTCVFLKGCPLKCVWCHNPEGISPNIECHKKILRAGNYSYETVEEIGKEYTLSSLLDEVLKDRVFWDESGGGLTLSGGEPLLQYQFLVEILTALKSMGIHTCLDTTGYVQKSKWLDIIDWPNLFLFDIKMIDNDLHKKYTGVGNTKILSNFISLIENNKNVRVRIPMIPGINSDERNLSLFLSFLKTHISGVERIDLLPYHAIAGHKYQRAGLENLMQNIKPLDKTIVVKWQKSFVDEGFAVSIGG